MNNLPIEIQALILNLLNLRSQINLIFACKRNKILMEYWEINQKINVNDEKMKLCYYDCFVNIEIHKILPKYPKKLKHLKFSIFLSNDFLSDIKIPLTITHLNLGFHFNQPLNGCIPNTVIKLALGYNFNQPITKGDIPNSVIKLTFGEKFNQPIEKGVLPESIKILIFGYYFDPPNLDFIPSSVHYLRFCRKHDATINNMIPSTVKNVVFMKRCYMSRYSDYWDK